jgi:hypothetical protein
MITVIGMTVVGQAAKPVVQQVCRHNQQHSRKQHPQFVLYKKLFHHQKQESGAEYNQRYPPVVMPAVTMRKRIHTYAERKQNHTCFKRLVFDNIDSKQGQAGEKKRQQGTMNGTGQRGRNAQNIPVHPHFHEPAKLKESNIVAKFKMPNFAPCLIQG